MAENQKTRKRLAEVMATPEFQMLTEKQQAFCAKYLSGGLLGHYDAEAAVRAVYNVKSARNGKILGYEILANPRVKKVIQIAMNLSERDAFLIELEKTVARSKGVAKIQSMKLFAKMKFGIDTDDDGEPSAPRQEAKTPARFKIGDIAIRADKTKLRVTAVDEQGRVTEGEPLPCE